MLARIIFVCALAALITPGHTPFQTASSKNSPADSFSPVQSQLRKAYQEYLSGRLGRAAELYQSAAAQAVAARDWKQAALGYQNAAGAMLKMGRYRPAAALLARARSLAIYARDSELACVIASNLSALHHQMSDHEAAVTEADAARSWLSSVTKAEMRASVLAQAGTAYAYAGLRGRVSETFSLALREAAFSEEAAVEARVWDALGSAMRKLGELEPAENAYLEAYRVRALRAPTQLPLSYARLGIVRLERGDGAAAQGFLKKALAAHPAQTAAWPAWSLRYYLGRAYEASGQWPEALEAYRSASSAARLWRAEVLPADEVRVQADVRLQDLYDAYLHAAARLYSATGSSRYAEDVFAAAEQNRAASLREALTGSRSELPEEYWELLARLREAATRGALEKQTENWRARMFEMEAQAGLLADPAPHREDRRSLACVQRSLSPRQAIFSFAVQERQSYLVAVAPGKFHLLRLPPRGVLQALAQRFLKAVRENGGERVAAGRELAGALFGGLPPAWRRLPEWKLILDDFLFEIPFAALPADAAGASYLIERHSLEILPGALHAGQRARPGSTRLLAAFGDPVYNRADPRLARNGGAVLVKPAVAGLNLNRLAGSGEEALACARAWSGPALVALGPGVSSGGLRRALSAQPDVLHLALHTAPSGSSAPELNLALSLGPEGAPELLGREQIRSLDCPAQLVVMSGCSSGWGQIKPGAGVIGLSRAWLQAGAGSVLASLWPVPDDGGAFFEEFYRHLDGAARLPEKVPQALRAAQLAMVRSGSWRAEPRFWAGYFAVSRGLPQ